MSEKEGCATVRTGIEVNKLMAIVFKKIDVRRQSNIP